MYMYIYMYMHGNHSPINQSFTVTRLEL